MGDASAYSPSDLDFDFDIGEPQILKYLAADLRDGRFGVFLIHRNSREWWRLVAVFSSWPRARDYAEAENSWAGDHAASDGEEPLVVRGIEEEAEPAPDTLPPDPRDGPAETPGAPPIAEPPAPQPAAEPQEPLSDKLCERCGNRIPERRAAHHKTKYCSPECGSAAAKERVIERAGRMVYAPDQAPVPYAEPKQTSEPCIDCGRPRSASSGQRCAACYHARALEAAERDHPASDAFVVQDRSLAEVGAPEPPAPKSMREQEQDQIEQFIAESGARVVMAPEAVAEILRKSGRAVVIRLCGEDETYFDAPLIELDGKPCTLAALYREANKLRALAGAPPLVVPTIEARGKFEGPRIGIAPRGTGAVDG